MNLLPTIKQSVQNQLQTGRFDRAEVGPSKAWECNWSGYSVSFKLFTYIYNYLYSPPQIETDFLCFVLFLCSGNLKMAAFYFERRRSVFFIHNSAGRHAAASRRGRTQGGRCVSRYSDLSHSPLIYYPL